MSDRPFSLWEKVAEGWMRDEREKESLSIDDLVHDQIVCLHETLTPALSQRVREPAFWITSRSSVLLVRP